MRLGINGLIQYTEGKKIGQALRILIVHGYHTNIPLETLGAQAIQRSRNVWWTAYILECQMSVLMGVPLGIRNNEISSPLHFFPSSPHVAATVFIHVKLSQALGEVSNSETAPYFLQATTNTNRISHSNLWARWASNQDHFREEHAKSTQKRRRCGF